MEAGDATTLLSGLDFGVKTLATGASLGLGAFTCEDGARVGEDGRGELDVAIVVEACGRGEEAKRAPRSESSSASPPPPLLAGALRRDDGEGRGEAVLERDVDVDVDVDDGEEAGA